jgi:hypothetical protein
MDSAAPWFSVIIPNISSFPLVLKKLPLPMRVNP